MNACPHGHVGSEWCPVLEEDAESCFIMSINAEPSLPKLNPLRWVAFPFLLFFWVIAMCGVGFCSIMAALTEPSTRNGRIKKFGDSV